MPPTNMGKPWNASQNLLSPGARPSTGPAAVLPFPARQRPARRSYDNLEVKRPPAWFGWCLVAAIVLLIGAAALA
jgi:hypothetical protein